MDLHTHTKSQCLPYPFVTSWAFKRNPICWKIICNSTVHPSNPGEQHATRFIPVFFYCSLNKKVICFLCSIVTFIITINTDWTSVGYYEHLNILRKWHWDAYYADHFRCTRKSCAQFILLSRLNQPFSIEQWRRNSRDLGLIAKKL